MDENKEHFNVAYNIDCMEYMKSLPDNAFDLAVVDPPYGDASVERERETDGRITDSEVGSTVTKRPLRFHGGDRWNKYLELGGWRVSKQRTRNTLPRTR